MKNLLLFPALFTCVFLLSCRTVKTEDSKSEQNCLFWEVSGKGMRSPAYVFGTIHLACKEDIVFGENVKNALRSVSEVYFEVDLDDPAATMSMMSLMKMGEGKLLSDFFSESDYERLRKFFKDSLSIDVSAMNRFKPFFLLSSVYPKLMPCKNMSGIDMEILKLAKANKKPVNGLESLAFQASVFDSIPYRVQATEVLKMIDSFSAYKNYLAKMSMDYRNRNLSSLQDLMARTDFDYAGSQELMLNGRNRNWVAQLKEMMPRKNIFVAVGAGHLPGEQGLISLLRKEGFTVKPAKE